MAAGCLYSPRTKSLKGYHRTNSPPLQGGENKVLLEKFTVASRFFSTVFFEVFQTVFWFCTEMDHLEHDPPTHSAFAATAMRKSLFYWYRITASKTCFCKTMKRKGDLCLLSRSNLGRSFSRQTKIACECTRVAAAACWHSLCTEGFKGGTAQLLSV